LWEKNEYKVVLQSRYVFEPQFRAKSIVEYCYTYARYMHFGGVKSGKTNNIVNTKEKGSSECVKFYLISNDTKLTSNL
jgi:hypothetical protein